MSNVVLCRLPASWRSTIAARCGLERIIDGSRNCRGIVAISGMILCAWRRFGIDASTASFLRHGKNNEPASYAVAATVARAHRLHQNILLVMQPRRHIDNQQPSVAISGSMIET